MIAAAAAMLAVAQSSTVRRDDELPPATEVAILAGARACIGATVDPAGQDARLAGWPSVVGNDPDTSADGVARRVARKDGVLLTVKTGIDGGCVVQARGDVTFDKGVFLADLGRQASVAIDGAKPRVDLPNGEFMIVQIGGEAGKMFVQLVVANPKGKHAHVQQGN
ncbi:hypothetical protein [Sphingomonas bacterium]|uniref:hypothetical protein n=1 Tax=Sphingomonas bacterium TaxID=1895847 RepID=UPI0015773686|nr:hypothetical protein [Sphingomonas bacterium]